MSDIKKIKVNLICWKNRYFGIGKLASCYEAMFKYSQINYLVYHLDEEWKDCYGTISIFVCNHQEYQGWLEEKIINSLMKDTFKIGVFSWEMSEYNYVIKQPFINEIFTISTFCEKVLCKAFVCPVRHMKVPSIYHETERIPNEIFTIFSCLDLNSDYTRKNPFEMIEVFKRFSGKYPSLYIMKIIVGNRKDVLDVIYEYSKNSNIKIILDEYSEDEMIKMYNNADCILSLHRSEGLGFSILDSLFIGKPVIASNFSSSSDFIDKKLFFPVSGTEVYPNQNSIELYQNSGKWFQPDLDEAYKILEKIYLEKIHLNQELKCQTIQQMHDRSIEECSEKIKNYLYFLPSEKPCTE